MFHDLDKRMVIFDWIGLVSLMRHTGLANLPRFFEKRVVHIMLGKLG